MAVRTPFPIRMFDRICSCCLLLLALWPTSVWAATASPNFVIILTDDQSWVGSSLEMIPGQPGTRSTYYHTPNIERLATMGMQFTRGYAPAPFCCPTRRSLVIGQTPARHIYQKDQSSWGQKYRQQLSIPQMLKQANANYRTAHLGKWDSRFDNVTPEQMGYDVSDGLTGNSTGGGKGSGGPAASDDPKLIFDLTKRAGEFMHQESAAGNPFFVQISHYAVHLDIFYRQATYDEATKREKDPRHTLPEFAAMTEDMDIGIGQLIDKIGALGIRDHTYIFFLSDNGGRETVPGESNTLPRNHPLRDGKGSMYEGGIRVPFIVCGPQIQPGSLSHVPVTGLDFMPTIAELCGYNKPLPASLDGGSMTAVLQNRGVGKVDRNQPFLLFHQAVGRKGQSAIMRDSFKVVKTWKSGQIELFNLDDDIGEQNNLANSMPEKANELHSQLVGFLNDVGAETNQTMKKGDAQSDE